jgi:hypothetical protein
VLAAEAVPALTAATEPKAAMVSAKELASTFARPGPLGPAADLIGLCI